jgi:sugar-specific transcriptional regulator TrmB
MQNAILCLKEIGFSDYEAKAYVALLRENPLTAYEIARSSGIPTSKIYEVLRRLERRNTIQSIRGSKTTMFIPVSPEEFIQKYQMQVEENIKAIRSELGSLKIGIDVNYIWHIKDYDEMILRAKRMLTDAKEQILMLGWRDEIDRLVGQLRDAHKREVDISIIHYGTAGMKIGKIYPHPIENTIYSRNNVRGFSIVIDSREAMTGTVRGASAEALWSMNRNLVMVIEDYLRHDIFMIVTLTRLKGLMGEMAGKEEFADMLWDRILKTTIKRSPFTS